MFAKQIDVLLEYFSKDKLLILFQEDLISDPEKVYEKIFEFLAIHRFDVFKAAKVSHNISAMPRFRRLHSFLRGKSGVKKLAGMIFSYKLKYLIVTKLIDLNMKSERYPEMDAEIAETLKKNFLDDINRLEILTGRNLDHWK